MFSTSSNPCLKALKVACLKSPPSVCFICALPVSRVILRSVNSNPPSIPLCFLSNICVN